MTQRRNISDPAAAEVHEEVQGVLRAVAGRLPEGCARVDVEEGLSIDEGEWRCTLRPTARGAECSEVVAEVSGSEVVSLGFGVDSYVEVTARGTGWRDPRFAAYLDEIEAVADAVVRGRLTETLWRRGGLVRKSRAIVGLPDGPYKVSGRHTLLPLWGCPRTTTRFREYCVK